jgi:hypothetical protein
MQTPATAAHIDRLDDELLARIIRLLWWRERIACVELVSRRWNRVAKWGGWRGFTEFNDCDDDFAESESNVRVGNRFFITHILSLSLSGFRSPIFSHTVADI